MWNLIRELFFLDLIWAFIKRALQLAVLFLVVLIVYLLWRGESIHGILGRLRGYATTVTAAVTGRQAPAVPSIEGPPDFTEVIPASWSIERLERINVDGDEEDEWLMIYRYDKTARGFGGPLGGVIYDPQPDRHPAELGAEIPYRPSAYIPYRLLPTYGGMGYLGERARGGGKPWPVVETYDVEGDGQTEVVIQGFSGYDFPTYLSVFKWVGKTVGYRPMIQLPEQMIWADAGVEVEVIETPGENGETIRGPLERVIARRRLSPPIYPTYYLRSQMCQRIIYRWNPARTALYPAEYSLDFCFGRPEGASPPGQFRYAVTYPEEALLAHYDEGVVEDIILPVTGEDQIVIDAIARIKEAGQTINVTWRLTRESEGKVGEMTVWKLELGKAVDPSNQ